jgi:serine protease Do
MRLIDRISIAIIRSVGVGFAIPSAIVSRVVPRLITDRKFTTTYIGIQGGTLTSDLAQAMNLYPTTRGILVETIDKTGPAAKAGVLGSSNQVTLYGEKIMVGGDLITAVDNHPVKQFEDMTSYLFRYTEVSQTITLTILRGGKTMTIDLTLAARPGSG